MVPRRGRPGWSGATSAPAEEPSLERGPARAPAILSTTAGTGPSQAERWTGGRRPRERWRGTCRGAAAPTTARTVRGPARCERRGRAPPAAGPPLCRRGRPQAQGRCGLASRPAPCRTIEGWREERVGIAGPKPGPPRPRGSRGRGAGEGPAPGWWHRRARWVSGKGNVLPTMSVRQHVRDRSTVGRTVGAGLPKGNARG